MATFECDGNPHDSLEDLIEECESEQEAYEKFVNDNCGNEIEVSEQTGMAHAGVVSAEVWCDECGKHYTGSETRAKLRKQQED